MIKIVTVICEQDKWYHVHNSDGGHDECESNSCLYVLSDKLFDMTYNEAFILRSYEKIYSYLSAGEYNHPDFNDPNEWANHQKGIKESQYEYYYQGGGHGTLGCFEHWGISDEAIKVVEELNRCSPNKFAVSEVLSIDEIIKDNTWDYKFLTSTILKKSSDYYEKMQIGLSEISSNIFQIEREIENTEKKLTILKRSLATEKQKYADTKKDNVINILAEGSLSFDNPIPLYNEKTPQSLALYSGNKKAFWECYKSGVISKEEDSIFLLLRYGFFSQYHKDVDQNIQNKYQQLNYFYALYNANIDEIENFEAKDFISFLTKYYDADTFDYSSSVWKYNKEMIRIKRKFVAIHSFLSEKMRIFLSQDFLAIPDTWQCRKFSETSDMIVSDVCDSMYPSIEKKWKKIYSSTCPDFFENRIQEEIEEK
jgi:hypothetical protein